MNGEAEATSRGTILLADDNPQILGMLAARLEKRGYLILTAGDGEEALELARTRAPALVILDVMMPRKNGWEVARALKQSEDTARIKVVVLTAIGESINEMTSPLYGADAYLDKPFDFGELERTIRDLIG
jgi:DNA-binding response OmpR family regulator